MTRFPITKKEYEKSNFIRIENILILAKIFYSYFPQKSKAFSVEKTKKMLQLLQNNKQLFIDTFGKQDFVWTSEYKEYAWAFKLFSGILIVFTGNRGTAYEFEGTPTEEDAKELKELFDFIINSK